MFEQVFEVFKFGKIYKEIDRWLNMLVEFSCLLSMDKWFVEQKGLLSNYGNKYIG